MSRGRFRTLDAEAVITILKQWAEQVGRDPDVLKVVLFGSLARADHTGRSDADLLVIVAQSDLGFLDRPLALPLPQLPVPVDLFVYTAQEMAADGPPPLAARALNDGIVLHDRMGHEPQPS